MNTLRQERGTIRKLAQNTYLLTWIEAFLIDRKAQNMASGTLSFYRKKLSLFSSYCESRLITEIEQITPNDIRMYLLHLEEQGHNPGGVHCCFTALRAFLLWYEGEAEPDNWKNPIRKVKAPKKSAEPLDPVELDTVNALVRACEKGTFTGERDRAIFYCLLDTGARAEEFVSVDLDDVEQVSGAILIRQGKGGKFRTVYLGKQARKALRSYLKARNDNSPALWVTDDGQRLAYSGLRQIVRRRSEKARVPTPSLHSFRRAFALNMLRNGVDIYSLQELMGHADLQILRRYLKQTNDDLRAAHARGSPADRLKPR